MSKVIYEDCPECDKGIEVEVIYLENGERDYQYLDFCPHCQTDLSPSSAYMAPPEDMCRGT